MKRTLTILAGLLLAAVTATLAYAAVRSALHHHWADAAIFSVELLCGVYWLGWFGSVELPTHHDRGYREGLFYARVRMWWRFVTRCVLRGHVWGIQREMIASGPMHVPPDEREYVVFGAMRQCERCSFVREVVLSPGDEVAAIERARDEAEEDWDDPAYREWILRQVDMVEQAFEAREAEAMSQEEFMRSLDEFIEGE